MVILEGVNQHQPLITVIGDGQLARMMAGPAAELGIKLRVVTSDPASPAGQVIPDHFVGDYQQAQDLLVAAAGADALTFEHEHVPAAALAEVIAQYPAVRPHPAALQFAQDKLAMRKKLREIGAPIPPFMALSSPDEAREFFAAMQGEVCLKAIRGGYDGHGVWFPASADEAAAIVAQVLEQQPVVLAEKKVKLVRELSALLARSEHEVKLWPVVESIQRDGICNTVIAPAPGLAPAAQQRLAELAQLIATELNVTGVLAVELFETQDENGQPEFFVNELAMRPHNTGHWTQDGCVTSQFEQHLRAVLNLPLGDTTATAPVTVMENILGAPEEPQLSEAERMAAVWQRFPQAKIHVYGKAWRSGRKLGHVNISGSNEQEVRAAAAQAAHMMRTGAWMEEN